MAKTSTTKKSTKATKKFVIKDDELKSGMVTVQGIIRKQDNPEKRLNK